MIVAPRWRDPGLEVLQQRGMEHEQAFVEHLRQRGFDIADLRRGTDDGLSRTEAAMCHGFGVIVQPTLQSGRWHGRADILLRVETPSALGEWSYQPVDTKLATETRAGAVLQLCLYADLVGELQGVRPEYMHVVRPGTGFMPETFRADDFFAYYRLVRGRLEAAVDAPTVETYPEPVPQCDICRWWPSCDKRRRADDHLSLVAGVSRLQRRQLEDWDVRTLEALAKLPVPLKRRPKRGAPETYVRSKDQARVQFEGRIRGEPVHELLPFEEGRGLARLPEPSRGDVFFDIEGDPFAGEGGLEYLFGFVSIGDAGEHEYRGIWALDRGAERAGFESFVDFVMDRLERFPSLHVFHYAPYEPAALKRLMGRYATREVEVDRMLRADLFVDLHSVTKQALRASVERYSIKDLEKFYGFERETELRAASANLHAMERALELGTASAANDDVRTVVESYNREDCVSARELRDWLERLRAQALSEGARLARPAPKAGDASDAVAERQRAVDALKERLLQGIPDDPDNRTQEQRACWLLANLLEFHRRESKAGWHEFFRLCRMPGDELLDERSALSGLRFEARIGGTKKSPIDRYSFPAQDFDVLEGADLCIPGEGASLGTVVAIDPAGRIVDIKKHGKARDEHPAAAFVHSMVSTVVLADALMRLGQWVAENGIDAPGPYRAARDLLLRLPPRLVGQTLLDGGGDDIVSVARQLALSLDSGVLPIQGPPGAGKTFAGARMICELVAAGKKVGVTAVSHKVIRNVLDGVLEAADQERLLVGCIAKVSEKTNPEDPRIHETTSAKGILSALGTDKVDVAGGTAWLWAREDLLQTVDVLFVDEAAQMSLANVLAVSQCAESVVLLGDPRQLEQPIQGSHPEGAEISALEHLLDGRKTLPSDRGLFLPETFRLHPSICAFTSELFYESRLRARPGLEKQVIVGPHEFSGAGLWFVPVEHEGHQNSSWEEAARVAELVGALTAGGACWENEDGDQQAIALDDILIMAPYNAQVAEIARHVPGARVGTVDKFQGQEAPMVIYSMATSSPGDAPRGMEFLYSLNRLNVATSRARCLVVVVASSRLLEPECRTPRQIQLANALCRYKELAR